MITARLLYSIGALTCVSVAMLALPANAQEGQQQQQGRGMRFDFAPNVYKMEGAPMPRATHYSGPISNARPGSTSKSFLPSANIIAKPIPVVKPAVTPIVQPQVTATIKPQPFSNLFGKPIEEAKPAVAQQMPAIQAKPAAQLARSTNTAIKWSKPRVARPAVATGRSMPATQTYGSGYVPGNTAPTNFGSGTSTSTSVTGVVKSK
jgi:hypothetical protein